MSKKKVVKQEPKSVDIQAFSAELKVLLAKYDLRLEIVQNVVAVPNNSK